MPEVIPLPCRHRAAEVAPAVYHCSSPKLVGLKVVTSEDCGTCYCRDHAPEHGPPCDAGPRLRGCAYLGAPLDAAGAHACHQPAHRQTTVTFCRSCPDYLFPVLTPRTSVSEVRRFLELPPCPQPHGWWLWPAVRAAHAEAAADFLRELPPYPRRRYRGRGVVFAGGGKYFPSLYVAVRALRHVGCRLPIQAWFLGRHDELPADWRALLAPFGVECVDADAVRRAQPARVLDGWELKVYAALHSPFEEVLFLDADCYPCRDPEFLFDRADYRARGAIFWPELFGPDGRLDWAGYGVADPRRSASVESGQFVLHKRRSWQPLNLAWFYNNHSDYYYHCGYGDKHTFEVAWAACRQPYVMWEPTAAWDAVAYLHAGPDRQPLFVHRCADKFRFKPEAYSTPQRHPTGAFYPQLPLERECWGWLADLARALGSAPTGDPHAPKKVVRVGLPAHFNGSVFEHRGRLLFASREGAAGARVHLSELGPDYQPLWTRPLDITHARARHGVEDPRLFSFRGRLHCAVTGVEPDADGWRTHQLVCRLTDDLQVEKVWLPEYAGRTAWEKNWQFFEHAGALYSVYSVRPHLILRHRAGRATVVARTDGPLPWRGCHLRGGAPPVRVGEEYYHFFHSMREGDGRFEYSCSLYTFEARPPFAIRRVAPAWILTPDEYDRPAGYNKSVVFPCGAIRRGGEWVLSYGYHDQECRVAVFDAGQIEQRLRPV